MANNEDAIVAGGGSAASRYPKVRRIRFRFGQPEPMKHHFVEGDIAMSHFLALLSAVFPIGEESFIRSVRLYAHRITDPVLKERVAGFIGQESVHSQEHRRLNDKLIEMGYQLLRVTTFDRASRRQRLTLRAENSWLGRGLHLPWTVACEHMTAVAAERLLSSAELQAIPGDPEVWNLLNWHAVEELEHKSVAFDVYRALGGPESVRIACMRFLYYLLIPSMTALMLLSIALDPRSWRPIKVARQVRGVLRGPLVKGLRADMRLYMQPGFHPDDIDTNQLVERWQAELFGTQGALVDHLK